MFSIPISLFLPPSPATSSTFTLFSASPLFFRSLAKWLKSFKIQLLLQLHVCSINMHKTQWTHIFWLQACRTFELCNVPWRDTTEPWLSCVQDPAQCNAMWSSSTSPACCGEHEKVQDRSPVFEVIAVQWDKTYKWGDPTSQDYPSFYLLFLHN